jgi:predicted nucleic acid-binding protein
MIVVDTSVWVAALRDGTGDEGRALGALLDADEVALPVPVRIEILAGASKRDLPRLRRSLSALPLVYPGEETWSLIDAWLDRTAGAGQRFGFGDLLIGALASETGALVWSLDADFARMRRAGLIDLYEPALSQRAR